VDCERWHIVTLDHMVWSRAVRLRCWSWKPTSSLWVILEASTQRHHINRERSWCHSEGRLCSQWWFMEVQWECALGATQRVDIAVEEYLWEVAGRTKTPTGVVQQGLGEAPSSYTSGKCRRLFSYSLFTSCSSSTFISYCMSCWEFTCSLFYLARLHVLSAITFLTSMCRVLTYYKPMMEYIYHVK
jgi:hypothetical protein